MPAQQVDNPAPTKISKSSIIFDDTMNYREFIRGGTIQPITPKEVFTLIKDITDPEHPLTLEELSIIDTDCISIHGNEILVEYTPTIPHCSQASLIGLSLCLALRFRLPANYKSVCRIARNTHNNELIVNRQLKDKERVDAAMENPVLRRVVLKGIVSRNPASMLKETLGGDTCKADHEPSSPYLSVSY